MPRDSKPFFCLGCKPIARQCNASGPAISSGRVATGRDAAEPQASPERLHRDVVRLVGADSTLVMLVAVDGASQGEVAAELGLTAATARKRYQRALRRARETLSEAA